MNQERYGLLVRASHPWKTSCFPELCGRSRAFRVPGRSNQVLSHGHVQLFQYRIRVG